jgi:hypothetical protein
MAQILRRIDVSLDEVSRVLARRTRAIAQDLRRGTNALVDSDAANALELRRAGVDHRKAAADYVRKFPGKWVQPPLRRIDNAPELVADELERIFRAGDRARWANYSPGLWQQGHRAFEAWLKTEGPLAPLNEHYGLNCWEMVTYAATRAGVLDKHQLRDLVELRRRPDGIWGEDYLEVWVDRMGDWLIPEGRRRYTGEPESPRPQRGDIVVWNSADHVTVATGRTGADGSPELYSFWNMPKYPLTWDEGTSSYSAVSDAVQVTTVDELTNAMYGARDKDGNLAFPPSQKFEIFFGRGPW